MSHPIPISIALGETFYVLSLLAVESSLNGIMAEYSSSLNIKEELYLNSNIGHGHPYDDSSAPSLHGKKREIGAKEVNIKVSMPFIFN